MKQKQIIRENFRGDVFDRDEYKCVFCDITENLDAHHITDRDEMPNGGYVKENGITVCKKHHMECEKFHITEGKQWILGRHPNDLYSKIGSSHDLAYKKSEQL